VFDKTGTLTDGKLGVIESHFLSSDAPAIILALVANNPHPVARAVKDYVLFGYPALKCADLEGLTSIPGKGIEADFHGLKVKGGSIKWLTAEDHPLAVKYQSGSLTVFAVKLGDEYLGFFGLADAIRPDAIELVQHLKRSSKEVQIVSGDNKAAVKSIATRLGLDAAATRAECTPESKQHYVRELQAAGAKKVMFVGDGTNDSLALVQADVGVSLNSGTDVAISAADVVLISPTPLKEGIETVFRVSQQAHRRIMFNFYWPFFYNLFAITLAAGAFVKFRISPQFAGLGEMVSILPVVLSAWTIRMSSM
jgi:cation transport ATPase